MNYKSLIPAFVLAAYSSLVHATPPKNLECPVESSYAEGLPHRKVCIADRNHDGTNDYQERRTYDFLGNLIQKEIDRNFDGSVDSRTQYQFDLLGRKTRMALDRNNDGSDEVVCTWNYNRAGQVIRSGCDYNGDGIPDRATIQDYSANGQPLRIRKYIKEELVEEQTFSASGEIRVSWRD